MSTNRLRRRARVLAATVAAVGLLSAACSSSEGDVITGSTAEPVGVDQAPASEREDVPSALDDPLADGLPTPTVDVAELRSGGPPPDGIPAVDEPTFLPASEVGFLAEREPVMALEVDGEARAYPVQVLIWHEIVNDTVAGTPVAVTYCPLCNTAIAYEREVDGRVLDFGVSGLLYNSSLVMFDRQTESLWSHITGEAFAGTMTGTELESIPVGLVSWDDWRDANPDGLVLSTDTGHDRPYGSNPYPGYDDVDVDPFLFDGDVDGRFPAKERVVGLGQGTDPVAIPLSTLLDDGVVDVVVDGRPIVVVAKLGTASPLERTPIEDGRDVGATGAFVAELDGAPVSLSRQGDRFVDATSGSTFDVLGTAVDGPLAGRSLDRVDHVDTFWFAWGAFEPETRLAP